MTRASVPSTLTRMSGSLSAHTASPALSNMPSVAPAAFAESANTMGNPMSMAELAEQLLLHAMEITRDSSMIVAASITVAAGGAARNKLSKEEFLSACGTMFDRMMEFEA